MHPDSSWFKTILSSSFDLLSVEVKMIMWKKVVVGLGMRDYDMTKIIRGIESDYWKGEAEEKGKKGGG